MDTDSPAAPAAPADLDLTLPIRIYTFVRNYRQRHGVTCSGYDLIWGLKTKQSIVKAHVRLMVKQGYLRGTMDALWAVKPPPEMTPTADDDTPF